MYFVLEIDTNFNGSFSVGGHVKSSQVLVCIQTQENRSYLYSLQFQKLFSNEYAERVPYVPPQCVCTGNILNFIFGHFSSKTE